MEKDMSLSSETIDEVLYPKIEPYATGMLPVSDRHTIAWSVQEIQKELQLL